MFLLNLAILKKEPSEKLQIIQFLLKLKNPFLTMAKIFKIGSGLACPYQILLSPSSFIIEEIFKISPYTEIFLLSYFYQISQFLFSPILEKLLGLDMAFFTKGLVNVTAILSLPLSRSFLKLVF